MTRIREGLHLGGPGTEVGADRRVNVSGRRYPGTTDRHPLSNTECDQESFEAAVRTVIGALEADETVLVHCSQGRSRSAAVVACVLAEIEDTTLREAMAELDRLHGIAVSDAMRECAVTYHRSHQD